MLYQFGQASRTQPVATKHETLTVNTAIGFTAATMLIGTQKAFYAFIGPIETDQIRVWFNTTAPTNLVGHLFQVGDVIELWGTEWLEGFKAIKVTNNASVPVTFGF